MKHFAIATTILISLMLCATARAAEGQTVVNPATLDFDVSPDHNAVDAFGNAKVTSYVYNAVGMNGSGAVAVTVGLGMPVPVGTKVTMPLPGLAQLSVNVIYTATVTAVGPAGSGVSAPSNPFGVAGSATAPGAPSNVRVR